MTYDARYRRILHLMDYYKYLNGLINRYSRQEGRWDAHLGSSRQFILKCIDYFRPETVTILGSGWLLDVPLSELASQVRQIFLVDIVHPPDVYAQTREMKNVELIEDDITGGISELLWEKYGRFRPFSPKPDIYSMEVPEYRFRFNPGLVISLNLMSQLAVLPVKLLERKGFKDEEKIAWLKMQIQERHLHLLQKHNAALITDILEVTTTSSGVIKDTKTILIDLPETSIREEWSWDFDLGNIDFNTRKSILKVIAMIFENEPRRYL